MELRHLRHFVAVAEAGSISAAARLLRLTQPALSRQIKALEDDLGTALLERGAKSVTLTAAGETLRAEGKKLLRASETLIEKVRAAGIGEALRIGYAPSLAGDFLAVAIQRFTQLHPQVRVSLSDSSSAEMCSGLGAGNFDLIVAPPSAGSEVRWTALRDYDWCLAVPASHPLAKTNGDLAPAGLAGQRLLLYDREHYPDYWERVTAFSRQRKLQAKVAGEFDGINSLLSAVEAGLGVAFVSGNLQSRAHSDRIVLKSLQAEPERILVAAGVPAKLQPPPIVLAFIEELKRAAGEEISEKA